MANRIDLLDTAIVPLQMVRKRLQWLSQMSALLRSCE